MRGREGGALVSVMERVVRCLGRTGDVGGRGMEFVFMGSRGADILSCGRQVVWRIGCVVLWLEGKGREGKESEVEVRLRAWVV